MRQACRARAGPVLLVLACVTAACNTRPPLADTSNSADALARQVLEAVARRDRTRLQALGLSEQEFKGHVWPELPAARPERNLPFSYVWGDLHQKSDQHLTQTLKKFGGRSFDLVRVAYEGETTRYASFTVYRDTVLTVRDDTGVEHRVRLYGSTLQSDGAFKVFSYVVDD